MRRQAYLSRAHGTESIAAPATCQLLPPHYAAAAKSQHASAPRAPPRRERDVARAAEGLVLLRAGGRRRGAIRDPSFDSFKTPFTTGVTCTGRS
jgi:hypothetical protein